MKSKKYVLTFGGIDNQHQLRNYNGYNVLFKLTSFLKQPRPQQCRLSLWPYFSFHSNMRVNKKMSLSQVPEH